MDRLKLDDLEVTGKKVLTRVDFNVPLADGKVADDTRIRAALPTINKILADGGKLILMSHLGRPEGQVKKQYSLAPVAQHLSGLIGQKVQMANDCVGAQVEQLIAELQDGQAVLLENTRFHKEETANDADFSGLLARSAEVYVNDAFGSAHRAHASTVGVTKHIKEAAAGYLLQREVENLSRLLDNAERPFVTILGGAKVSDKLRVIHNFVTKVSTILIGGGMAYTFLKSDKISIGSSLYEKNSAAMAYNAMVVAKNPHPHKKVEFLLPVDHVIARENENGQFKNSDGIGIPDGWKGVDIGTETIKWYSEKIITARTIFWNGPMGIFENSNFAKGTMGIAESVAKATENGAFTVVGGGDSIAAIHQAGVADKLSFISTGGGASLEFLGGIDLPGIMALTKTKKRPVADKKTETEE
jgi:phosphoglycerate kinase